MNNDFGLGSTNSIFSPQTITACSHTSSNRHNVVTASYSVSLNVSCKCELERFFRDNSSFHVGCFLLDSFQLIRLFRVIFSFLMITGQNYTSIPMLFSNIIKSLPQS